MCFDPQELVKKWIEYYTQVLDVQVCIDDSVEKDMDCFLNGVKNHVSQWLDVDILEDKVELWKHHVTLANDKCPGWDGLTNELFKKYVIKLKWPFTLFFQKIWP